MPAERGGDHGLVRLDLELLAVLLVVDPLARERQVLARLHAEQVADRGHRLAPVGHRDLDHAPGALLVGEGHAIEHPLERSGRARCAVTPEGQACLRLHVERLLFAAMVSRSINQVAGAPQLSSAVVPSADVHLIF